MQPHSAAPSMMAPPAPLVRACRDVITSAGVVTTVLAGPFDPNQESDVNPLDGLRAMNPALADALMPLMDAVMELDERTGFLGTGSFPVV